MLHGTDTCYWKDIYTTPSNPTALNGTTPLHRLKPFYMLCGIFKVAKINTKYRYQLTFMLIHKDARDAVNLVMAENKIWMVQTWHSRCKKNAMQLIINQDSTCIAEILLNKEPMFIPRKEPNAKPRFANGTEPALIKDGTTTTFINLDINVGEHMILSYTLTEMRQMGNDYPIQIIRTWRSRAHTRKL